MTHVKLFGWEGVDLVGSVCYLSNQLPHVPVQGNTWISPEEKSYALRGTFLIEAYFLICVNFTNLEPYFALRRPHCVVEQFGQRVLVTPLSRCPQARSSGTGLRFGVVEGTGMDRIKAAPRPD